MGERVVTELVVVSLATVAVMLVRKVVMLMVRAVAA